MNLTNIFLICILLFAVFADFIFKKFKKQSNINSLVINNIDKTPNRKNRNFSKPSILFTILVALSLISLFININPIPLNYEISSFTGIEKIVVSELIILGTILTFFSTISINFKFKGIPLKKVFARELLYLTFFAILIPIIYFAHSKINSTTTVFLGNFNRFQQNAIEQIRVGSQSFQSFNKLWYPEAVDLDFKIDSIQLYENRFTRIMSEFKKRNDINYLYSDVLSLRNFDNFKRVFGDLYLITEYEPDFSKNGGDLYYKNKEIISDYSNVAGNYTLGKFLIDTIIVNNGPLSYQLKKFYHTDYVRRVGNSNIKINQIKVSKPSYRSGTTNAIQIPEYFSRSEFSRQNMSLTYDQYKRWLADRTERINKDYTKRFYIGGVTGNTMKELYSPNLQYETISGKIVTKKNVSRYKYSGIYLWDKSSRKWYSYKDYMKDYKYQKYPNGNQQICQDYECTYSKTIKNYSIEFTYIPSPKEKLLSLSPLIDSNEKNNLYNSGVLNEELFNEIYFPKTHYLINNLNTNKIENTKNSILQKTTPSFKNASIFILGLAYGYRTIFTIFLLLLSSIKWAYKTYNE